MGQVTITTGARLHFGILAHAPASRRRFGGVGLMIDSPGYRLSTTILSDRSDASTSELDCYQGPPDREQRVLDVVHNCRLTSSPDCLLARAQIRWSLRSVIPSHVGLGSGTQLGLAVAQAWQSLQQSVATGSSQQALEVSDPVELARLAGRGLRSALGIHGFQQGGLLVEAGKKTPEQISPRVARADFPPDWRILLITPPNEIGLSGTAEIAAFKALPAMADTVSAALCRIILLELLPAAMEADFAACSAALFQFGWTIGEYFAPAQGGVFASRRMTELVGWLRTRGVQGVGQSSWGPMIFVLCDGQSMAEQLQRDLRQADWADCDYWITAPRNCGAKIEIGA